MVGFILENEKEEVMTLVGFVTLVRSSNSSSVAPIVYTCLLFWLHILDTKTHTCTCMYRNVYIDINVRYLRYQPAP